MRETFSCHYAITRRVVTMSQWVTSKWILLWPSVLWQYRFGSILAQEMACYLTASSHHMNTYWLLITYHYYISQGSMGWTNRFRLRCGISWYFKLTTYGLSGKWIQIQIGKHRWDEWRYIPWASCQIRKIAGCACAGNAGLFFPPPLASDPDMHHGTYVTHVPWCMPGSLTSGFLWSRWRGKRSRHSQRMRNPESYVSGKRPMNFATVVLCLGLDFTSVSEQNGRHLQMTFPNTFSWMKVFYFLFILPWF